MDQVLKTFIKVDRCWNASEKVLTALIPIQLTQSNFQMISVIVKYDISETRIKCEAREFDLVFYENIIIIVWSL